MKEMCISLHMLLWLHHMCNLTASASFLNPAQRFYKRLYKAAALTETDDRWGVGHRGHGRKDPDMKRTHEQRREDADVSQLSIQKSLTAATTPTTRRDNRTTRRLLLEQFNIFTHVSSEAELH